MHIAVLSFITVGGGAGPPFIPPAIIRRVAPKLEYLNPSGNWIDVTKFVRVDESIVCEYGIQGSDPATDHIADAGTLSFTMDDGAKPYAVTGLSAPQNPNRLFGWNLNAQIRYSLGPAGVGTRYYKFLGSLAEASPDPNPHGELRTYCTALDVFDDLAQMEVPFLPVVQGARSDTLITMVLDGANVNIPTREIDVGVESFPVAFDGAAGQGLMAREAAQQVTMSEFGYLYRKGNLTNGCTVVYENRSRRVNTSTVLSALSDVEVTSMDAPASRDDIFKTVRVVVHPLTMDPSDVTLWSLDASVTTIADGQTLVFVGAFRNPNNPDQLAGGLTSSMIQPVAYTDYTMNVALDGTGGDLTLGFSVIAAYTGLGVKFQVHNASGSAAFITKLECRGRGLYRSDAAYDSLAVPVSNTKIITVDMPFQSSLDTAADVATLLINNYQRMVGRVKSVTFCASRTQAMLDMAMQREPGDRVTVTNSVTGFVAVPFTINSVRYEVAGDLILWTTWGLEPAPTQVMWQLDVSHLDTTTTLGF